MAELNLKQIIDRLNAEFTGDTRKLVFWYDDKVNCVYIGVILSVSYTAKRKDEVESGKKKKVAMATSRV